MKDYSTRRQFLGLAGSAAVLGTVPLATLRPAEATPASMASVIRTVVGDAVVRTGKVKLDVPPLVENGNTVSMTVRVTSPMAAADHVVSIHVFNEKNPQPNMGNFYLPRVPAARRYRPASASPIARKSSPLPNCPTARSGRPPPMSW